jgi:hypothetical protein
MALTGQLEKMKIIPFFDKDMLSPLSALILTPMYNPTSLTLGLQNQFDLEVDMGKGDSEQKFIARRARTLSNIELFFDGTGAAPTANSGIGINTVFGKNIYLQIQTFQKLAMGIEAKIHRPPFFLFVWGTFVFPGVITKMDINYNLFDSNGVPIRAKVTLTVEEHISASNLNRVLRLLSPDLSQSRIVKAGDTLPNLAKEIYDDETLFLELAKANGLKNYRKLKPGQTIIFPPVEKIKAS